MHEKLLNHAEILETMVEYKLVISDPKTGKSVQREAKEDAAQYLGGHKIGDTVTGDSLELAGYEFMITGGSDNAGFPMRKDFIGTGRRKILAVKGVGLKMKAKGIRQRKMVAGNTVYDDTAQINLKVLKEGKENLFVEKKEEGAEAKTEDKAAEKVEAKKEVKQEEKKETTENKQEAQSDKKEEVKESSAEEKKEVKQEEVKEASSEAKKEVKQEEKKE